MDPYSSYDPNASVPPDHGPNGSPADPGAGYVPGQAPAYPGAAPGPGLNSAPGIGYVPTPETTRNIGYPPPVGPPAPGQGPYPGAGPYQAGVPGMPPQYATPMPPQRSGMPAAGWIGIALGAVLVLALGITGLVVVMDRPEASESAASTTGEGSGGDTASDTSGSDPTEAAVADPVADAVVGDCFYDYGDETTPDLEATACGAGTFEAIDIVEGTTDLSSCDGMAAVDTAVSSTGADRVLCLSYTAIAGDDAYHAQVDECVYGSSTPGSPWNVIDCQDGAFKVIERLEGESSISACSDSTYFVYGVGYTTGQSYLDVTLCLQMIYASGDAGYAEIDDCLSMNSDYTYFEFVSDCGDGNVYVTGRTNESVDSESWCNGWGWSYEEVPDFPELSFTICWGYL
ncbi:hypothetical protein K3N28_10435 [Glycomyces sp. TRM65418]|uniref:LppU/SCO3897 family protein n=1 Tax=Glycomyces sp. TRM65418 TaxID=2867006 RepID=UPI001CE63A06|nr:hypothetical protein [Glycomyces sp. TRM65418]MCC3763491.1 hypothetical protein [Glycomyces sp. TRM65418]QZD57477.1 hypothetical protein K3N28_10375 [Glycomyces sp. TRM65418]